LAVIVSCFSLKSDLFHASGPMDTERDHYGSKRSDSDGIK